MARVTIRGGCKNYGGVEVIHGVDVEIADGEFVIPVGPSGCGKSTLLRRIAGQTRHRHGLSEPCAFP